MKQNSFFKHKILLFFKKIIDFLGLFLLTLLMIFIAFFFSASDILLNKNYTKSALNYLKLYEKENDKLKVRASELLYNNYGNSLYLFNLDVDAIVNNVITQELLNEVFTDLIDKYYNNQELIINMSILQEGYAKNLENYLAINQIILPQHIINGIISTINHSSTLDNIQIPIKYEISQVETIIFIIKTTSTIVFIIILLLSLLINSKKIIVLILPPIAASTIIMLVKNLLPFIISKLSFSQNELDAINYYKYILLQSLNNYCSVYFTIGIMLLVLLFFIKMLQMIFSNKKPIQISE